MQYMQKLLKVFPIGTAAKFGITEEEKSAALITSRRLFPLHWKSRCLKVELDLSINLRSTVVNSASCPTQTPDGCTEHEDCAKAVAGFIPRLGPYVQVLKFCHVSAGVPQSLEWRFAYPRLG